VPCSPLAPLSADVNETALWHYNFGLSRSAVCGAREPAIRSLECGARPLMTAQVTLFTPSNLARFNSQNKGNKNQNKAHESCENTRSTKFSCTNLQSQAVRCVCE